MSGNFWGDLIRDLREERRLSQRELAAKTQVNRSTLRKIETGKTSPDVATLECLMNFMGYELEAMTNESLIERQEQQKALEADPVRRSQLAVSRILQANLF